MESDINRTVFFLRAPPFLPENTTGINNSWIYKRAPEGYLFLLDSITLSTTSEESERMGIFGLYDGHEYTHWNIFPGVESRELLFRGETNTYILNLEANLNQWKCKEYTIGLRSHNESSGVKVCIIVWYYLKKATREELLEFAIKHPTREDTFKRALRGTTVEPGEA